MNEKQTLHLNNVDPAGGNITLTYHGGTASFAPGADAATVQAALARLPGVGAGNVKVTSQLQAVRTDYALAASAQLAGDTTYGWSSGGLCDHNLGTIVYPIYHVGFSDVLATPQAAQQLRLWADRPALTFVTLVGSVVGDFSDSVEVANAQNISPAEWVPDATHHNPQLYTYTLSLSHSTAYRAYSLTTNDGSYNGPYDPSGRGDGVPAHYAYGIAEIELQGAPVWSGDYTLEFQRGLAGQPLDLLGVDASSPPGVTTSEAQAGHVGDWTVNLAQNVQPGQTNTIQSLIPQTSYQIRWEAVGYAPEDVTPGPPTTITTTPPEVDAMIQNAGDTAYIGQGVWSLDGDGESVQQSVTAGTAAVYNIQVQNNAPISEDLTLSGPAGDANWSIVYLDEQGHNVTPAVTGAGWILPGLSAGGQRTLTVQVTPGGAVADGDSRDVLVTAMLNDGGEQDDAVLATTTAYLLPTAVTLSVLPPTPDQPTDQEIDLSWTPNNDAGFGWYEIHRSTTPGFTPDNSNFVDWDWVPQDTTYADTGLTPGTTYYYQVVVYNWAGSSAASNEVSATTTQTKTWQPAGGGYNAGQLCWDKDATNNWFENGRLMAPVDQRGNSGSPGGGGYPGGGGSGGSPGGGSYPGGGYPGPTATPTPTPAPGNTLQVAAGSQLACAVEKATDWDYWTMGGQSGYEADTVNYKWAYTGPDTTTGSFIDPADPTQDATTTLTPTWVAPTTPGTYTLTCTIDDAPAQVGAGESGSRDDDPVVRSVTVQVVAAPVVTFSGEIVSNGTVRACAGGWDDHDAKDAQGNLDSQYRAHTRMLTAQVVYQGQAASNLPIEFEFAGNVGHDYGNDASGHPISKLTARVHDPATPFNDASNWKPSDTRSEDINGNIGLWVKSSDIISHMTLQAFWTDSSGNKILVGSVVCDFDTAEGKRNFSSDYDPPNAEDLGWLFNRAWLGTTGTQTTAKVYMKFKKDTDKADVNGNWNYVNNHQLHIAVGKVDLIQNASSSFSQSSDYATVANTLSNGRTLTQSDGAATVIVTAGSKIDDAWTVWFDAYDQSQWDQ